MKVLSVYIAIVILSLGALSFNPYPNPSLHEGQARISDSQEDSEASRKRLEDLYERERKQNEKLEEIKRREQIILHSVLPEQAPFLAESSEKSIKMGEPLVEDVAPPKKVFTKMQTTVDLIQERCDNIESLLRQRIEENDRRNPKRSRTGR